MGPQSDFKESINERKQMEQRCLPAHCSEMENNNWLFSHSPQTWKERRTSSRTWGKLSPLKSQFWLKNLSFQSPLLLLYRVKTLERTDQLCKARENSPELKPFAEPLLRSKIGLKHHQRGTHLHLGTATAQSSARAVLPTGNFWR